MSDKEKFERYEKVRQNGDFNMFDPRARQYTGLSKEDYDYVINNYIDLKIKYGK